MGKKLLALAMLAAVGGAASAADDTVPLGRFKPTQGGFGGSVQSTAATAADKDATDDTELTHFRRYYGGGFYYRGYGWGVSYTSYSYYRPYYSYSYCYYRPVYYYPAPVYYYPAPVYITPAYYYPVSSPLVVINQSAPAQSQPSQTYQYDGGPKLPAPQPKLDKPAEKPMDTPKKTEASADTTNISLKKSAYKFPAYGEK